MSSLGGPSVLVPTISTYRDYLSSPETNPFSREYQAVLEPYIIDSMNATSMQTLASMYQNIYTSSQQESLTPFLLWHATPGISKYHDSGRVSLLHSISHNASRMVCPTSQWDDRTFANRGDVSYDTTPLVVWDPTYIHLAPAICMPSVAAIYTYITGDPNVNLIGPYGAGDTGAEIICCCKNVYFSTPNVVYC